MTKQTANKQLGLDELGQSLRMLGFAGVAAVPVVVIRDLLTALGLAEVSASALSHLPYGAESEWLVATSRLFTIGLTRDEIGAVRRVLSLQPAYRQHLLRLLLVAIQQLSDDCSLADTLEQLDHLTPELLSAIDSAAATTVAADPSEFSDWDLTVWQAPDAITLLSRVVERPEDIAEISDAPIVTVGFGWLQWETPPAIAAPAPWGDADPLKSPLTAAEHPFWGAMIATLDACTGDYPWQSLTLRGGIARSMHRALGPAEQVLEDLWRNELGLWPAAPVILEEVLAPGSAVETRYGEPPALAPGPYPKGRGELVPWFQWAVERMAQAGVATQGEGAGRLTGTVRTGLIEDDQHMRVFELVRRRSYRLARAAEHTAGPLQ